MLDWHQKHGAEITIATIQAPPEEAGRFGMARSTPEYRITGFEEKPQHKNPARSAVRPRDGQRVDGDLRVQHRTCCCARCTKTPRTPIPRATISAGRASAQACEKARVVAYDFRDINDKQIRYWRDVGTLDAYYEANMDLVDVVPEFNLYDQRWPIRTRATQQPPAKFVFAQEGPPHGRGGGFHRERGVHRFRRPRAAQRAFAGRARKQLL
jgi:glucose-1-phosphate adenylyltransferase